eukprot:4209645-Karenia_brevis.AAC.1
MVEFGMNPHKNGTKIYGVFEATRKAGTIGEAKKMGATLWELRDWVKGGSVKLIRSRADSEVERRLGDSASNESLNEESSKLEKEMLERMERHEKEMNFGNGDGDGIEIRVEEGLSERSQIGWRRK